MRVRYFPETDTLFIQLNDRSVVETRELNENLLIDLDERDKVASLTVEHAMEHSGRLDFSYETSPA